MNTCKECIHAEMCKWIDELEGRGCDFEEPCEDAISREAVKQEIKCWIGSGEHRYAMSERFLFDRINELPPVQPSRNVIEDIKADIEAARYGLINDGLDVALRIIDKHIGG